jgi:tetratricopeptide (TPR) repeat protein
MATILWVWEMGGGLGHTLPIRPVLKRLQDAGHRVAVALRDLAHARLVDSSGQAAIFQAPVKLTPPLRSIEPPATFAHILNNSDFAFADALLNPVLAWRSLFDAVKPDWVVLDHSPTALLALRGTNYRRLLIGHGFFTPPDIYPLPDLRPWLKLDPQMLHTHEDEVLAGMNAVLAHLKAPPLQRIGQLFAEVDENVLCTLPELDHYPQRAHGTYWSHWSLLGGAAPQWPDAKGPRIFAYLKAMPGLEGVIRTLGGLGVPVLVFADGVSPQDLAAWRTPTLHFATELLDFVRVADECTLAVLNATHYSVLTFLLSGRPLVQLPLQLEQAMTAERTAKLGASVTVLPDCLDTFPAALDAVLNKKEYALAAQAFACKHIKLHPAKQGERLVEHLLELLAKSGSHAPHPAPNTDLKTALAHHARGTPEQRAAAVAIYRNILAATPGDPDALHLLGVAELQDGRPQAALAQIEQAIALRGGIAAFHINAAEAARQSGNLDTAERHARRALALLPENAEAHNNLGLVLLERGQLDPARELFERALKLNSGLAVARGNLERCGGTVPDAGTETGGGYA